METTNKITINGIAVPDGTDVKTAVENGNLVITFSKESEVEEPKFKNGDFIYVEDKYNDKHVALFGRDDYKTSLQFRYSIGLNHELRTEFFSQRYYNEAVISCSYLF